ncbi:hypothetical protein KFE25_011316 [Diacronema lutheri]|uniref:F-box domain-containing protein n=1 Tax=Diacronema lutheri TaxID=2081491 RepID=A0A8J5X664_DIALT|nr:hypothetical protein KFE25_011316 [Diacronema lutheri]
MRAELATMREIVGAQLRRLEQRVARMERAHAIAAGACAAHAAPRADKGGAGVVRRVERAPARSLRLDDLSADVLASIAAQLPEDDELAAALTCRKLRGVVERRRLAVGKAGARTRWASALGSSARLKCLLLEMRAELATMREIVGAQLRRLEQRVARMERAHAIAAGACAAHAAPRADKGGAGVVRRVERAPARSLRLDDLSADVLASIAAQLPEDDELAAALTWSS